MKFFIESDGTAAGTILTIDGNMVSNVKSVFLSSYLYDCSPEGEKKCPIDFSYSTVGEKDFSDMRSVTNFNYCPATASMNETKGAVNVTEPTLADYKKM
jgi:hypothetical protein